MTNRQDILRHLCSLRRSGYGGELPGQSDAEFIVLAEHYATSDALERDVIRSIVPDDCRLFLLGFSDRLAIVADRTSDRGLLALALVAHSIEDFQHDERENMIRLALVNHVAEKLGAAPAKLFAEAAQLSSPRGARALHQFNGRPTELKSLRAMGIVEQQTDLGVDYRHA